MALRPFSVQNLFWNDISQLVKHIIPPLTNMDHKGVMGRIGIVGGSKDYCGAPFYASTASLHIGGDLSYVFCSKFASSPIKSYSPEAMVTPFYDDAIFGMTPTSQDRVYMQQNEISKAVQIVIEYFSRLHTLVIGPGLGRNENTMTAVEEIIKKAKASNISLVIDADGLWMISNNLSLINGYKRCVLTPNRVEFDRLIHSVIMQFPSSSPPLLEDLNSDDDIRKIRAVASILRVTIVKKGASDMICSGSGSSPNVQAVFLVKKPLGSPRRCGGQGDVLAGSLGTSIHWAIKTSSMKSCHIPSIEDLINSSEAEADDSEGDEDILMSVKSVDSIELDEPSEVVESSETVAIDTSKTVALGTVGSTVRTTVQSSVTSHPIKAIDRDDRVQDQAQDRERDAILLACILASSVTRRASELAFKQKGRAMTSPDVLSQLGLAFADLEGSTLVR